jgi:hypothetical protein
VTTGWDATHRVYLAAPWDSFWLDVYDDPPAGDWVDLSEAVRQMVGGGEDLETGVNRSCVAIRRLIAATGPGCRSRSSTGRRRTGCSWRSWPRSGLRRPTSRTL